MFFSVARLRLSLVSALFLFSTLSRAHERTIFTSSVSYCSDPQEILVEQFNVAYFPTNNSVSFNVSAASVLSNLNVTAQLYVNVYGMHPINTTINLCSLFSGILCPLPQYNFTGWDTLQLPDSVKSTITDHLPGIAFIIPNLEAFAQLTLYKENTNEVVACLQTTLANGWSARQYAVEWTSAALTLFALASAIWKSVASDALALAPIRLLDFVVLLQTIAASGLLGLNFPSLYTAFTLNFSWILGLFPQSSSSGMQNSIAHMRRLTGGDSSDASSSDSTAYVNRQLSPYNMLVQPASILESVAALPRLDLRNATARSLVKASNTAVNATSRLIKAQADVAVVTNDDGSDVLQAGVPIYVNTIGVATANAFMTVFLTALIYTAVVMGFLGVAFALYIGVERTTWGQRNLRRWTGLQSGFVPFAKAWGLRAVITATFPLLIFIFFQWTLHDSWLSILLSVITLVVLMGLVLPPLFFVLRPYLPHALSRAYDATIPTSLSLAPLSAPFREERIVYAGLILLVLIVKAMVIAFGHAHGLAQAIVFLIVDVLFFLSLVLAKPFRTRRADILQGYLAIVRMVCSGLLIAFVQTVNLAPIPRVVIGVITAVIFAVAVIVMFFNMLVNIGLWQLFKDFVCCGRRRREGDRSLASQSSDPSLDDKHPERDAEKDAESASAHTGSSQYDFVDRPGNPTPPETRSNSHAHTHLATPDPGSPLSTSVGSERPSILTDTTSTLGDVLPRRWSFQHSRPPSTSDPSPSAGSFLIPSSPSSPASTRPASSSQRHSRHPSASVAPHSPIQERYSDEHERHAV
ncbi:TRP-domain-containing protein [Fomitopsis betulina]|nr:TRP-domain-containing protein [Fomitopsis betulina]